MTSVPSGKWVTFVSNTSGCELNRCSMRETASTPHMRSLPMWSCAIIANAYFDNGSMPLLAIVAAVRVALVVVLVLLVLLIVLLMLLVLLGASVPVGVVVRVALAVSMVVGGAARMLLVAPVPVTVVGVLARGVAPSSACRRANTMLTSLNMLLLSTPPSCSYARCRG